MKHGCPTWQLEKILRHNIDFRNPPSFFLILYNPPPLRFVALFLWLNVSSHRSLLSLGTLVPTASCCVFYAKDSKFTEGLAQMMWFLLFVFDITHIGHTGTNRITNTYQYIILTPPVMCTRQLPVLHWIDILLVKKNYLLEIHNVFAFQKLLTYRSNNRNSPFLSENFEPPLFDKISKSQPLPLTEDGRDSNYDGTIPSPLNCFGIFIRKEVVKYCKSW